MIFILILIDRRSVMFYDVAINEDEVDEMRRLFLILAVCLGTFMATLDISIVNVALPAIGEDLGASLSMLQWIIDAYALCLSALILSVGPISDRYGRKKVWLMGIVIFTLGSAICAFSTSSQMLIIGRIIQGIAAAALIPGALSIITQAFNNDIERIKIIGVWSAVSALSLIIGPILGGFLVDTFDWMTIFLINIPIGLLTLFLGFVGIDESADPDKAAFDPLGQLLSIVALGSVTFALIEAGDKGWGNYLTLGGLIIFLMAVLAFIWVEKRVKKPLLPFFLFKKIPISFNIIWPLLRLVLPLTVTYFLLRYFCKKGKGGVLLKQVSVWRQNLLRWQYFHFHLANYPVF